MEQHDGIVHHNQPRTSIDQQEEEKWSWKQKEDRIIFIHNQAIIFEN